jgi:nicotinic acid phosphoribosyltransferase
MLDEAGFPDTKIVLSNQLDELVIWQIITQVREEAAVMVWMRMHWSTAYLTALVHV